MPTNQKTAFSTIHCCHSAEPSAEKWMTAATAKPIAPSEGHEGEQALDERLMGLSCGRWFKWCCTHRRTSFASRTRCARRTVIGL